VGLGVNLMFLDCERKVGYDPSDYGADICKRHGIAFTTDLSSVKEETFSVVICHHVLEHVSEPTKCLQDVWRILAPGGTLIACVPFETQRGYRHYDPLDPNHHLYSWNVQTLTNLVSAMGFTVLQAKLSPFGYEQRLAFIGHHSFSAYCLALWCVRKLRPVYEILLIAERPDHGTTFQSGKNRNVG
jgi:SAM-dependent methyltransferase